MRMRFVDREGRSFFDEFSCDEPPGRIMRQEMVPERYPDGSLTGYDARTGRILIYEREVWRCTASAGGVREPRACPYQDYDIVYRETGEY